MRSPLGGSAPEDVLVTSPRRLTLAVSDYDQVRDLVSGVVRPQGIDLTCLVLPVEEIFYRFLHHREWHVSELSMAKYTAMVSQGDTSLRAIPVFPSRIFRHSSIYVRSDSPLTDLSELMGKRVGLPEWAQTAAVYSRALLTHQYGVNLADVEWVQAGVNEPGRAEKVDLSLPAGVAYRSEPNRSLNEMLLEGDLDAVMTAHAPHEFESGGTRVRRLLTDAPAVEREYYQQTGIFPIMHVIAIRDDVLDADPWVAMELYKAFEAAKQRSLQRATNITASRFPIPWVAEHGLAARELFGADPWPYGVDANRTTLEAFLSFAAEQGVTQREVDVEELFVAQTHSSYRI